MLNPNLFTKGENELQVYYAFKNEVTQDLVQIIRNKSESHYWGSFINNKKDICKVIPVYYSDNPNVMLDRVCEWYNSGMPCDNYPEPPKAEPKRITDTLTEIECIFGHNHDGAKRIQAYLDEPCAERWDDIHGIIVRPPFFTVWNALIENDPTFPRQGRRSDITGKIVREWERIPTEFELLKAIKKTVN